MAVTSDRGVRLIKNWEGLRLEAYKDAVGVWTIGYGHTGTVGGQPVGPGMRITEFQAEQILRSDLGRFERGVQAVLARPASQDQFDAFVALAFNIGVGGFQGSSVVKRFNQGDLGGCIRAFLLWIRGGGQILEGLVNRRAAEVARFVGH